VLVDDRYDDRYDYPDDDETDGADSYIEDDGYGELAWPAERRWRPAAAIIGAVVAVGAIATAVTTGLVSEAQRKMVSALTGVPASRSASPAARS